jgi:hypothetical protein
MQRRSEFGWQEEVDLDLGGLLHNLCGPTNRPEFFWGGGGRSGGGSED